MHKWQQKLQQTEVSLSSLGRFAMIPEAFVCHHAGRRMRIRIPSAKGNVRYFETLEEALRNFPEVEEVSINPTTASVLILSEHHSYGGIKKFAKKEGLFHLQRPRSPAKTLLTNVTRTFEAYDKRLKRFSGNELDIPSMVFLALLVSGIIQIARGNLVAPAWYTAFYYALGIFTRVHEAHKETPDITWEDFDDADAE